jgi:predicted transcriptional regulator
MATYRDRYDIFREVLEIVNDNDVNDNSNGPQYRNYMNKTRLAYTAGLTHPQTKIYFKELIDLGLISAMTDFNKPYPYYEITERGRRCLELFNELENDLRPMLIV